MSQLKSGKNEVAARVRPTRGRARTKALTLRARTERQRALFAKRAATGIAADAAMTPAEHAQRLAKRQRLTVASVSGFFEGAARDEDDDDDDEEEDVRELEAAEALQTGFIDDAELFCHEVMSI